MPVRLEAGELALQDTAFALTDLRGYFLREQSARWWVSNQTDDLLCLPFCRIERLDYQVRTALRVIGPLRGRALLSDEVGLGKTIEAGLVLKEYLTRGLVRRFLVLTVPFARGSVGGGARGEVSSARWRRPMKRRFEPIRNPSGRVTTRWWPRCTR